MNKEKIRKMGKKELMKVAKKAKAENDYFKSVVFDEFYETSNKKKGDNMERKAYKQVEVAKMMGVHRNSVYRWVRDGKIKSVLVAGVRMIPASEIEKITGER